MSGKDSDESKNIHYIYIYILKVLSHQFLYQNHFPIGTSYSIQVPDLNTQYSYENNLTYFKHKYTCRYRYFKQNKTKHCSFFYPSI